MGRLCFGSYFKILTLCKSRNVTQEEFGTSIFDGVLENQYYTDKSVYSRLKSCSDKIPNNISSDVHAFDIEQLIENFKSEIIEKISPDKHCLIISSLIELLKNDTEIDETIQIGKKSKREYLLMREFVFVEVLVDFYCFTLKSIDNKSGKDFIDEINETYMKLIESRKCDVMLINSYTESEIIDDLSYENEQTYDNSKDRVSQMMNFTFNVTGNNNSFYNHVDNVNNYHGEKKYEQ